MLTKERKDIKNSYPFTSTRKSLIFEMVGGHMLGVRCRKREIGFKDARQACPVLSKSSGEIVN